MAEPPRGGLLEAYPLPPGTPGLTQADRGGETRPFSNPHGAAHPRCLALADAHHLAGLLETRGHATTAVVTGLHWQSSIVTPVPHDADLHATRRAALQQRPHPAPGEIVDAQVHVTRSRPPEADPGGGIEGVRFVLEEGQRGRRFSAPATLGDPLPRPDCAPRSGASCHPTSRCHPPGR